MFGIEQSIFEGWMLQEKDIFVFPQLILCQQTSIEHDRCGMWNSFVDVGVPVKFFKDWMQLPAMRLNARTGFLEALNSKVTSAMYLSQT